MSNNTLPHKIITQLVDVVRADSIPELQALLSAHQLAIDTKLDYMLKFGSLNTPATVNLLHLAIQANSHRVMEWLIGQGIDIEARPANSLLANDLTPLSLAGSLVNYGGPTEALDKTIGLLLAAGAGPQGLLPVSARGGNLKGVRRAVEAGADVNKNPDDMHHWKALHYAAADGNLPIIEYLIAQDADVNARHNDQAESTPLMLAASKSHPAALRLLLKHGANPGLLSRQGASIFFDVAHSMQHTDEILDILLNRPEILNLNLLNQSAPVDNDSVCSGRTPLTYAIEEYKWSRANAQSVVAFIRHGADWRQPDEFGQSILHSLIADAPAVLPSRIATIIDYLLQAGVDPFLQDKNGLTAYQKAGGNFEIEAIFKKHCLPLHDKALHFNPAANPLIDAGGKPTPLLWYACIEHFLEDMLRPARWAGQEKALIATRQQLAAALPGPFAKQYDALLDVTALRRGSAPKPASWLKRHIDTPSAGTSHEP